jgi:type IV pilus assembly protein PilX
MKELILGKLSDGIMAAVDNERGMTMVVTLMVLILLTVIGVAAVTTSTTETLISSAETEKRSAFYAAEAGVEHVTGILRTLCIPRNQTRLNQCMASGTPNCKVDWSFALNGTEDGVSSATTITSSFPSWMVRFNAGAPWVTRNMGNGYSYNVRVWNNNDSGNATMDTDGMVYLGAVGTGPHNGKSAIEVVLSGLVNSESATSSYTAQAGAGAGKNYNAADVGTITAAKINTLVSIGIP